MNCRFYLQKLRKKQKNILKQAIASNRILAELKGRADEIPNQSMLVNAITLQKAKDSSEIENIITTQDVLYKAYSSNVFMKE